MNETRSINWLIIIGLILVLSGAVIILVASLNGNNEIPVQRPTPTVHQA